MENNGNKDVKSRLYSVDVEIGEEAWNASKPKFRAALYKKLTDLQTQFMKTIMEAWEKDHPND